MGTVGRMDQPGCSHSAVIHSGSEDLVRRLVPHFRLAHSQAAAVLVCVDPAIEARVRAEMGSMCDGFEFRSADARYSAPGQAMTALHSFVADAGARGASSFWSIGAIPLEHDGRDHRWVRYEAAVSTIFAGLALRAVCLYDSVRTPVSVRGGSSALMIGSMACGAPTARPGSIITSRWTKSHPASRTSSCAIPSHATSERPCNGPSLTRSQRTTWPTSCWSVARL